MSTFVEGIEFYVQSCCKCNMVFAMTVDFRNRRLKDRATFHCPAGHGQIYTGQSEEQKLREQVERQSSLLDAERGRSMLLERERANITKAHKKMRVRVMNGVCPCCNRTFQNLLNHMKSEHPEFRKFDLRSLRTAYGLTQGAVAKEAGVNFAYVSSVENGRYVPPYAKKRLDLWLERNTESESTK